MTGAARKRTVTVEGDTMWHAPIRLDTPSRFRGAIRGVEKPLRDMRQDQRRVLFWRGGRYLQSGWNSKSRGVMAGGRARRQRAGGSWRGYAPEISFWGGIRPGKRGGDLHWPRRRPSNRGWKY